MTWNGIRVIASSMRKLFAVSLLACGLLSWAVANESCDDKAEMKRTAEQIRRCAQENKAAKLDECEENSPAAVKEAAGKVVEARHKVGDLEEQLAAAYESGDHKLIQQLHLQKRVAELECELAERGKHVAWAMNGVEELVREMPDSAEAKQLKEKTAATMRQYLENARRMMEMQKEQMTLEKGMEGIDRSIEIIRKREELKRLEAEAVQ